MYARFLFSLTKIGFSCFFFVWMISSEPVITLKWCDFRYLRHMICILFSELTDRHFAISCQSTLSMYYVYPNTRIYPQCSFLFHSFFSCSISISRQVSISVCFEFYLQWSWSVGMRPNCLHSILFTHRAPSAVLTVQQRVCMASGGASYIALIPLFLWWLSASRCLLELSARSVGSFKLSTDIQRSLTAGSSTLIIIISSTFLL